MKKTILGISLLFTTLCFADVSLSASVEDSANLTILSESMVECNQKLDELKTSLKSRNKIILHISETCTRRHADDKFVRGNIRVFRD